MDRTQDIHTLEDELMSLDKCRKFYRVYGISSIAWTKSD